MILASAYAHELPHYGLEMGLTNYAAGLKRRKLEQSGGYNKCVVYLSLYSLFQTTSFLSSGTQRLPHLVGLPKTLEMMLTSKPVKGTEAHSLGLVDAVVPRNELLNTARQWALDILERRKPWVSSLYRTDRLETLGEAREIFKFVKAQARKQAPNLKHPLVCIDVIEEGVVSGPRSGLWKEADAFQELLHSHTCKSLVHIFLLNVELQSLQKEATSVLRLD